MQRFIGLGLAGAILLGLAQPAMAHDYKVGDLTLKHPFSRETPKGARVGAGYLVIQNDGDAADRLVSVACECAEISEIHEMKMDDGIMRMRALPDGLVIPPGQSAELKPGGNHLMFIQLNDPFEAEEKVKATLTFERAGSVDVVFQVEPLRKPKGAKGHDGHGDHKGHGNSG